MRPRTSRIAERGRSGRPGGPDRPQEARILGLDEAIERLRSPFAFEDFSPLTGFPILVVDFDAPASEPSESAIVAAETMLDRLPCPTVALVAGEVDPRLARWVELFDLRLDSEVDLARIAETTRRRPLAATALVQLLRQSARLDVHQGLIAESLVYSTLQGGPEFAAWLADHRASSGRATASEASEEPVVLVERFRGILSLTLNRPEKHNAFDARMRDALVEALLPALADPGVREIVFRGRGRSFCSGGDLDEFGTLPDPATAHTIRSTRSPARIISDLASRARFELHGACVGAGIELPAFGRVSACDDAFFQLPEIELGLVPGAGGTVSLPRRIGRQRTAWLALTGRRIDAPTAQQWGLVDEVVLTPHGGEPDVSDGGDADSGAPDDSTGGDVRGPVGADKP